MIVLSTVDEWFNIFPSMEIWSTFLAFPGIVLNFFLSALKKFVCSNNQGSYFQRCWPTRVCHGISEPVSKCANALLFPSSWCFLHHLSPKWSYPFMGTVIFISFQWFPYVLLWTDSLRITLVTYENCRLSSQHSRSTESDSLSLAQEVIFLIDSPGELFWYKASCSLTATT